METTNIEHWKITESKELLFHNFCMRERFGLKIKKHDQGEIFVLDGVLKDYQINYRDIGGHYGGGGALFGVKPYNRNCLFFKPYLRSFNKTTEKERRKIQSFIRCVSDEDYGDGWSPIAFNAMYEYVKFCCKRHININLPKDLYLEAEDGMYNLEAI